MPLTEVILNFITPRDTKPGKGTTITPGSQTLHIYFRKRFGRFGQSHGWADIAAKVLRFPSHKKIKTKKR